MPDHTANREIVINALREELGARPRKASKSIATGRSRSPRLDSRTGLGNSRVQVKKYYSETRRPRGMVLLFYSQQIQVMTQSASRSSLMTFPTTMMIRTIPIPKSLTPRTDRLTNRA